MCVWCSNPGAQAFNFLEAKEGTGGKGGAPSMSLLLSNMICTIDLFMLNGIFITYFIASILSAQKQIKSGEGSRLRAECQTEPAFQSQISFKSRHSESLLSNRGNRRYFDTSIFSWTKQGLLCHQTSAGGMDHSSIWLQFF